MSVMDIRQYFSPPRGGRLPSDSDQQQRGTPHAHGVSPTGHNQQQQQHRTPNRRRIITSDDDLPMVAGNGQAAAEVQNAEHQRHDQVEPAIVIDTSEDEPDDMWVRPRRSTPQQQQEQQPAPIQPHAAAAQQQQHVASPRNQRRQQPQPRLTSPRQRRRLEAAAEESAASDDDSSDCIESDTNAQDLYRAAIRGVRNARQARQQNRAVTEHCPVCSKFAAFLSNFM